MRWTVKDAAAVVVKPSEPASLREALEDVVAEVIIDARSAPEAYLLETLVLEGGE
jgi:hypothetical protein